MRAPSLCRVGASLFTDVDGYRTPILAFKLVTVL